MKALIKQPFLHFLVITLLIAPSCFAGDNFTIDDVNGNAGSVKVGDSVDFVYELFSEKQIKLENLNGYAEGQFCPGLSICLDGADKASFDIIIGWKDGWIIESINIYDKRFKTMAGFVPGSAIKQLRSKYRLKDAVFYEGRLYITGEGFNGIFISQFGGIPVDFIEKHDQSVSKIPDELVIEIIRI